VSLQDARKKALVALAAPEEEAAALKPQPFSVVLATYLEYQATRLRPLSLYQIKRTLNRHFKWRKNLSQITHNDVAAALDAIEAPSERAHALKDVRAFFNWCIPRYLQSSPCVGIKKAPQKSRDRVLNPTSRIRLWITRFCGFWRGVSI
jgi:hypothetical protein